MSKRKTVDPSLEKRDEDMDMDGSDEVRDDLDIMPRSVH